jgi:hypothetical protein
MIGSDRGTLALDDASAHIERGASQAVKEES